MNADGLARCATDRVRRSDCCLGPKLAILARKIGGRERLASPIHAKILCPKCAPMRARRRRAAVRA
jgi:hypothetical protein